MTQSNKNRLFEVMGKVDKSFKTKLNENVIEKKLRINEDIDLSRFAMQVNQPNYTGTIKKIRNGMWMLYDAGGGEEEAGPFSTVDSLMDYYDINTHQLSGMYAKNFRGANVNEMSNWGVNKMNPKYSHFAVLKDTNKIINGWEYRGYDPEELKLDKNHYFFDDIIDLQINPKIVNVVTGKYLQRKGIDPYDSKNWHKNDVDGTDIYTL
jgi:hypothetical protein